MGNSIKLKVTDMHISAEPVLIVTSGYHHLCYFAEGQLDPTPGDIWNR